MKPTRRDLLSPADELDPHATPFERAHHYGARRHTAHWLSANQAAVDIAYLNGFDVSDQRVKTLLSQVTLRVLDVTRTGKTGSL